MLHYKACARTRRQKLADIALMVFGMIAAVYTSVQTVRVRVLDYFMGVGTLLNPLCVTVDDRARACWPASSRELHNHPRKYVLRIYNRAGYPMALSTLQYLSSICTTLSQWHSIHSSTQLILQLSHIISPTRLLIRSAYAAKSY